MRSTSWTRIVSLSLALLLPLASPPARARLVSTAANCNNTSVGFVPLIDLGTGLYHGFEGGLYPGGSNRRPDAHTSAGLEIANAISPLDTLGVPDPAHGRIVLISIGMSNTTMEFQAFLPKLSADPNRNPRLLAVDCAVGGQAANIIRSPTAAYWDSVTARLRHAGSSLKQVQAVWLKEADANPTGMFPASAETLQWNLTAIVRILKQKLPNVKLAYLTSRIYAGYATTTLNPEPYAYESGFAVKWLIQSQISGDSLNFDPAKGAVEAPWLSWGPYLWADGLTPRSDGLTWACSEFSSTDGTHPSTTGRDVVADSLLSFFQNDSTAVPWFTKTVTGVPAGSAPAPAAAIHVYPVPARRALTIVPTGLVAPMTLDLFTPGGRLVRTFDLEPSRGRLIIPVGDLASGIYYLRPRATELRSPGALGPTKVVITR